MQTSNSSNNYKQSEYLYNQMKQRWETANNKQMINESRNNQMLIAREAFKEQSLPRLFIKPNTKEEGLSDDEWDPSYIEDPNSAERKLTSKPVKLL